MSSTGFPLGADIASRAVTTLSATGVTVADAALGRLAAAGLPAARAIGASREQIWPHISGSAFQTGGRFANAEAASEELDADVKVAIDMLRRPGRPTAPIEVLTPTFSDEVSDLAVTWLGHASALVELDGVRVLTDPVFSRRCSPSQVLGPQRMHRAPLAATELPALDVVLISHDHYDHLDTATVVDIAVTQPDAIFVAPVGVGAHLQSWGIHHRRIREADWSEQIEITVGATTLTFTCCPARHFSGRGLSRNLTQWASWAVAGPGHSFFFSGDTGFTERFEAVGDRSGPFDLTLIAVGAYDPLWPDIHVNPEEAVAVHDLVSGAGGRDSVLVPIHWCTFNLARHSWADPIQRLLPAAERAGVTALVPPPGGTIDLASRTGTGVADPRWWEASA
nr:MBL fold metallo-hydrolase [Gordonia soli]